jgi:hypothetical protein
MDFSLVSFIILCLAAYRVTHFIVADTLFEPVRNAVWKRFPPSTKIGYLFTCYWCTGFWVALFTVFFAYLLPDFTFVVSLVLAISAIIGIIATRVER